jgi:hypothetical protein
MENAAMPDLHKTIGEDLLEEAAEKLHDVETGSTWAGTAHFPGGEGDGAVCEADKAVVGEGDPEDRGSEGGEGGVGVVMGLRGDIPGDAPDLGSDLLPESSVAHVFFADGAVDGGEGFMEPEAQAIDGGEGDVVVQRCGGLEETPNFFNTENGGETVCGLSANA